MSDELIALSAAQKQQFESEGFLIVKQLFAPEEIEEIDRTFMEMSLAPIPNCFDPVMEDNSPDPLRRYPRMLHPHKVSPVAMKYMMDSRVFDILHDLFGREALAAQSMYYFKPPGARGHALHQDNFYLKVQPGTCIAAWTAVDAADEENGGMMLVPQTNNDPLVCPELADEKESFTKHFVPVPAGKKAVLAKMDKGDVLFFNGSTIHGSYRNRTKDRFRKAFISHYVDEATEQIGRFYNPLYRLDGTPVEIPVDWDSGPCGNAFDELYPH